jgi:hypothetical protein
MYVTSYRILLPEEKANYAIFQEIMNVFDISLGRIASSPTPPGKTDNQWDQILRLFSRYFTDKFPSVIPFQRVARPLIMSGGIGRSQYNYTRTPYYAENMLKKNQEYDPSKLAYSITVYMELYPGTSIPEGELKKLQCTSKWNAVRKAWSEFTGKPYIIKPVYSMLDNNKTQSNKNIKNRKQSGSLKKTRRKV